VTTDRVMSLRSLRKYLGEMQARAAARQRPPAWLALMMPFIAMFSVFCIMAVLVLVAIQLVHLGHLQLQPRTMALIFLGAFVAAIAPGLMFANIALRVVPSIRKMLDINAGGTRGASFRASMKGLAAVALITVTAGLVLILLAVMTNP
jgi:hypothetical protein